MFTAEKIAERIREQFPALELHVNSVDPNIGWSIVIPRQDGLIFGLCLNRQGGELHLSTSGFWLKWFPLEDAKIAEQYLEAVFGLLCSGAAGPCGLRLPTHSWRLGESERSSNQETQH